MYSPSFYAITSTIIVTLIAFVGLLTLSLKREFLKKILILLVSLSAGALLGDSFFHLLRSMKIIFS